MRIKSGFFRPLFFATRWTARAGSAELIEAYRATRLDLAAFEGPRYTRLKRLRELLASGAVDRELRWQATPAPR